MKEKIQVSLRHSPPHGVRSVVTTPEHQEVTFYVDERGKDKAPVFEQLVDLLQNFDGVTVTEGSPTSWIKEGAEIKIPCTGPSADLNRVVVDALLSYRGPDPSSVEFFMSMYMCHATHDPEYCDVDRLLNTVTKAVEELRDARLQFQCDM